jgi:hypothetical protein
LLPILRQEEAKKVLLNQNIGSSISVQQIRRYLHAQGEILKPRKMAQEKGRTEQSGYQLRNTEHPLQNCPVNHLCTSRTAGREIDRSEYADAVEENNKRYQKIRNCTEHGRRLTNIYLAL